ncbi:hypothetical protein COV49_04325 [Candidatus Falkowbacteria bacterium CG11_big_fil_rev_8_21_14_0_20_39_10]|uniref:Uncharacterized protein n=1 Tax=Candidatus Falkowbacteria bacterium CG11_big_fil_rev_8_21_14_0_20_39_10 TaxID=1974570 RepID=A0A2M6K807_9BACT|nr:MAG: hypothetical protein COV49_04325 [Candidatus Falkowbacteria bacterium CG11_big_fil_rev_8_21_14_0_20_39_10]
MDTISFRIKENFRVTERANFNTEFSTRNFSDLSQKERIRSKELRGNEYLRKFILHPIKYDEDTYYPSVEIYEKANSTIGKVEYEMVITIHSIPKLIFGNNFEEIKNSDKDKIVALMVERLRDAGILVSGESIKQAPVSVVHFCKNIVLPREIAIRSIFSDLSHTDMGKAYDTTEDVHRQRDKNGSKVVHLRCGSREWCFYDKADDARQPKSKRQDKTRTAYEKELLSSPAFENLEVFRYEYRLNKHQTIRSELHALLGKTYQDKITVGDLFVEGLWKAVLVKGWKNILQRPENQLALLSYTSSLDLLLHILRNAKLENPSAHSQNKALWIYGLVQAIKDHGAKTVKDELNKVWANKDNRLIEKLDMATDLTKDIPTSQGVFYITKQLEKFEIINLASLEKGI